VLIANIFFELEAGIITSLTTADLLIIEIFKFFELHGFINNDPVVIN